MNRRGFLVLEIMLAVVAAVLAAVAGFALLSRVNDRVGGAASKLEASNIARSVLAIIESGISTPENLHGSVQGAVFSIEDQDAGIFVRDPKYRLEIDTTPSQWAGLSQIDVTVLGVDDDVEVFVASQLIRTRSVGR